LARLSLAQSKVTAQDQISVPAAVRKKLAIALGSLLAVDANVLVRLLVRDDAGYVQAAQAFIRRGAWVSQLVLAETLWILDSVDDLSRAQIARKAGRLPVATFDRNIAKLAGVQRLG